ncbi:MAG TPA: response regulator transcription factor [Pseudonocardiaceae bacterium]|jgi:DNA-binding NarL/FixJ family response regulator|nr:response regulator transcription factor [Pseudonocardiaceae bacterium]
MTMHEGRTRPVRVAVHTFAPLTAAGIAGLLGTNDQLAVVAVDRAPLPDAAIVVAERGVPGLLGHLRRLVARGSVPVVLVTDTLDATDAATAIQCRVRAILQRNGLTGDQLVDSVLAVAQGGAVLPPAVLGRVLDRLIQARPESVEPSGSAGLTGRELDVLRLVADGQETKAIGEKLGWSERAVTEVIRGLMRRHELRNRTHAVAYALRAGAI